MGLLEGSRGLTSRNSDGKRVRDHEPTKKMTGETRAGISADGRRGDFDEVSEVDEVIAVIQLYSQRTLSFSCT